MKKTTKYYKYLQGYLNYIKEKEQEEQDEKDGVDFYIAKIKDKLEFITICLDNIENDYKKNKGLVDLGWIDNFEFWNNLDYEYNRKKIVGYIKEIKECIEKIEEVTKNKED